VTLIGLPLCYVNLGLLAFRLWASIDCAITRTTSFQLEFGNSLHMNDVLFVPGLRKNLLSISALEDKGYRIAFVDGQVRIWLKDSNIDVAEVIGVRERGLYKLSRHPSQALIHDNTNLCELWNRRFAHLHYKTLPTLRKMVAGIPELQEEHEGICRGCTLGKNTKGPYPSSDSRSKGILDLVQSNVCGPMTISSLVGFLYYVTFIDDISWKTRIYLIKTKDEVFSRFQEFKTQVENLTGKKIKFLRTDNGGEYISKHFSDFCKKEGINRELTVPYNP
jgi:hypothetical protein